MTGQEFRDYVVKKFKRTDKDAEIYDAITDVISDMRLQMKLDNDKSEGTLTALTILGQYALDVPTDFCSLIGSITLINNTTGENKTLGKISKEKYDEITTDRYFTTVANMYKGVPEYFCVYGNQILISPVPDSLSYVYKINYTKDAHDTYTALSSTVPFTDRYRNILRSGVLKELYDGMENFEESGYWAGEYGGGLGKIYLNEKENKSDNQSIQYSGV